VLAVRLHGEGRFTYAEVLLFQVDTERLASAMEAWGEVLYKPPPSSLRWAGAHRAPVPGAAPHCS
jgi:hypothetical protein